MNSFAEVKDELTEERAGQKILLEQHFIDSYVKRA